MLVTSRQILGDVWMGIALLSSRTSRAIIAVSLVLLGHCDCFRFECQTLLVLPCLSVGLSVCVSVCLILPSAHLGIHEKTGYMPLTYYAYDRTYYGLLKRVNEVICLQRLDAFFREHDLSLASRTRDRQRICRHVGLEASD